MSDMSFNQAKDLVERMEFSQISLKNASEALDNSAKTFNKTKKNFDRTLEKQEKILEKIPEADKKMSYMFLLLAINVGFILGLVFGKYIL